MAIYYKDGVRIRGTCPEVLEAQHVVEQVFAEHGFDLIITSGLEGSHSNTSLHYVGHARDYKSKHISSVEKKLLIRDEVKARLAPLGDFDFLLEDLGDDGPEGNEHFHLEYQPKGAAGHL